jgi:hypothetical protein
MGDKTATIWVIRPMEFGELSSGRMALGQLPEHWSWASWHGELRTSLLSPARR